MSARPLEGQSALVTGASRGIGRAISVKLGALGAQVFMNYRSDDRAAKEALAEVVAAGGRDAELVRGDVGIANEAQHAVEHVLHQTGRADILINNAGIQRSAMLHKMSDADWRDVMSVNLDAAFYLSRAVLPAMREAGRGHIINVTSASAFVAQVGAASYVASKHALVGLTKVMAMENAGRGIFVNAVAPGLTETDMVAGLNDAQRTKLLGTVPLGRIAGPQEVASLVGWLVTEARYSTGNVFHASGGVVMG